MTRPTTERLDVFTSRAADAAIAAVLDQNRRLSAVHAELIATLRDEHRADLVSPLLPIDKAHSYLRISRAKLYELIEAGTLARTKIGGRAFILRTDLDALIAAGRETPRQAAAAAAAAAPRTRARRAA
ncbi:helix-turn-helix domain-containing protein [Reyranella aquatilis]|uniref:Helix-turn-helix domain-containing protein n=1 Tax=Reyranella aquatilis TaxID=2035356 RepID=A0ABS8L197_9HYPH|nr:helix-turn-helix domain-containing protein [Reyranella aquatilis]MCC8432113.1 helix-turn-helix domain-containing protein [Reyranella aquatilis]